MLLIAPSKGRDRQHAKIPFQIPNRLRDGIFAVKPGFLRLKARKNTSNFVESDQ